MGYDSDSDMNVDSDKSNSSPSLSVEEGSGGGLIDRIFGYISDSEMNVSDKRGNGFGFKGTAVDYKGEPIEMNAQGSYDEFNTITASTSMKGRFYIANVGIHPNAVKGESIEHEHPNGGKPDIRLVPLGSGFGKEDLNRDWSPSELQMIEGFSVELSRLTGKVLDAEGNPVSGVTLKDKDTGNLYQTDDNGQVTFDLPADWRTLIGLRQSVEKQVEMKSREQRELTFQFGGLEITYVNNQGDPVTNAYVELDQVNGDHSELLETNEEGVATHYTLKPNANYELEVQGFTKQQSMYGEGAIVQITNQAQEGWNSPEGLPNTTADLTLKLTDRDSGEVVSNVPAKIESEQLNFKINSTDKGEAKFTLPVDTEFEVTVSETDKRYLPTTQKVTVYEGSNQLKEIDMTKQTHSINF